MRRASLVASAAVVSLALMAAPAVLADEAAHASGSFHDAAGNEVGWVRLVEDATGQVHVNVKVNGLAAGLHGIHIHGVGACGPTFLAAGGHFNPDGHQHGLDNPDGPHAGDLPNLVVNGAGRGHLNATTDRVTMRSGGHSLFDADGSAFIIHANPDDQVTNATNGGSGGRIACAVIQGAG